MNQAFVQLAVVVVTVAIDNALLAGLIVPTTSQSTRWRILTTVAVLIAGTQVVLAVGIGSLLEHLLFRSAAIVILTYMALKTVISSTTWRSYKSIWKPLLLTYCYTALGNLDNMIWLATVVGHHFVWLLLASCVTIPLFVVVSIFLAEQKDHSRWVGVLGAAMMAWVAASLLLIPPTDKWVQQMPSDAFRIIFTMLILCVGIWLGRRRNA